MKKRILWLSLALAVGQASHAFAQTPDDALRYSQLQFGGPARTLGIAGANVALGADFGNLTSNPAGLGLFQKSEVHISPGLGLGQSDAAIGNDPKMSETKNSFHLASIGAVFTGRRADSDQSSNWRGGSFALGFTRLADFNQASNYRGAVADNQSLFQRLREPRSSYNDIFEVDNNNNYFDLEGLGYGTALINYYTNVQGADSALETRPRGAVVQGEFVRTSGSLSQFDLGYGGSYRDRLYIGAALGIVSLNYKATRELTETENDPNTRFTDLRLLDDLKTTGTGINFRLGMIYRANDYVRLGASIQTPTFLRLTDSYSTALTANYDRPVPITSTQSSASVRETTSPYEYAYTLTTPFRANGGIAVLLSKYAFLTGDVEYVGYQQARLDNDAESEIGDNTNFSPENQEIKSRYQKAVNLRVGAEGRFDVFRVRLGFARYGDPYKADADQERAQNYYTGGVGLRQKNFFLDVAAVYTTFNQYSSPYSLSSGQQPLIKASHDRYTTTVTAGFTF